MYTMFLSSTFNDMQKERDSFHQVIIPKLNKIMSEYGDSFQLCDLRWGIDTTSVNEEESTLKILDVCFQSIKRSTPFFIVMLGSRYGWVPPIDATKNLSGYGLSYHAQSVTEMEIEYNTILSHSKDAHALFFFRNDFPADEMTEESRRFFTTGDENDRKKLEALKNKIRKENPGRVFDYSATWEKDTQSYSTDSFSELVVEKVGELLKRMFADTPVLTTEDKILNESAAFFKKTADLNHGNNDLMVRLFRDILTQIQGSNDFANEAVKHEIEMAGLLDEQKRKKKYDPFRGVVISSAEEHTNFTGAVYYLIDKKMIDEDVDFLSIPFVAGINADAQATSHLIACIIRALELKVLSKEGVKLTFDTDVRSTVRSLIDYSHYEIFPEGTTMGERYYMEKLLGYMRKKRIVPFLLCDHPERLYDSGAQRLEFLTATGTDSGRLYMLLNTTEEYYKGMAYLHSLPGHFKYPLNSPNEAEKKDFIRTFFKEIGKELPLKARDALLKNKGSSSISWLKETCISLSSMNEADFKKVRAMGDGAAAIEKVLIEKAEKFPESPAGFICDSMLEYGNYVDPALLEYVLATLSVAQYGLTEELLEHIAKSMRLSWNSLDFELITSRFSDHICRSESGLYSILSPSLKEEIRSRLNVDAIMPYYVKALRSLGAESKEYATECISTSYALKDSEWFWDILDTLAQNGCDYGELLYYVVFNVLCSDCTWALPAEGFPLPNNALDWFCNQFLDYLWGEDKLGPIVPLYEGICSSSSARFTDIIKVRSNLSLHYDYEGDNEKASRLFGEIFNSIDRLFDHDGITAVDIVSHYAYNSIWYRPDEKHKYADWAYTHALMLPLTNKSARSVIKAIYRYILAFEDSLSIDEINSKYQQIFDIYELPEAELCYRYNPKHKRDFFHYLKMEYGADCAYICDRYASFLAKNYKNVPADATVPCNVLKVTGQRGNVHSTVTGIETCDAGSYSYAAVSYRRKAIALSSKLFQYHHSIEWLSFWANANYNQATFKRKIGEVKYRTGDAYEYYENALEGYNSILKMTRNEEYHSRTLLYCADAMGYMGEIAKGFKSEEYATLPEKNYRKAYDIYSSFPVDKLKKYQKELYTNCCVELARIYENSEPYRSRAFSLLADETGISAHLYFVYYSLFVKQFNAISKKPLPELTDDDITTVAVTASLISRHMFYGLSAEAAEKRHSEHPSVIRWIGTFYAQDELTNAFSLYNSLCGYCCEKLYSKATNDTERMKVVNHGYNNVFAPKLGNINFPLIDDIINDDNIIDRIKK